MFSQIGQYALRTMVVLASAESGVAMRTKDLAPLTGVPAAYQSKVLRQLVTAGLLASHRGHHGGFRLTRTPEDVRLSEVLGAVSAMPDDGVCVFGWGRCNASQPCPLHGAWSRLSTQVMAWANHTTLAEIADEARSQPGP